ncbi:hypothetical protein [Pelagicoccus mobilis]|uniref:Uncharacterized protein n=1 Tax=Pelagicoccus mobilis TaxID=415221 RepID=A0A934S2M2_9BACT|nr:hypothetical protein [Pelagicoccus mobilis]MBK1879511.1 hypothetical protein [Pelagicoccus mobilis]
MAKDNLTNALTGLNQVEKKRSPQKHQKKRRAKRGRPKAFDPFYMFCSILVLLAIGLQFVAIALYS